MSAMYIRSSLTNPVQIVHTTFHVCRKCTAYISDVRNIPALIADVRSTFSTYVHRRKRRKGQLNLDSSYSPSNNHSITTILVSSSPTKVVRSHKRNSDDETREMRHHSSVASSLALTSKRGVEGAHKYLTVVRNTARPLKQSVNLAERDDQ